MQSDVTYMQQALQLARRVQNIVHPNPLVGAVIVKNGTIIGEGAHEEYGGPHAEVNALIASTENPTDATMYVNLEPCTYSGKTPPCVPEIIRAGLSRVVIGIQDPNPRVDGKGIHQLREAGIEVKTGVAENESREINRGFIHQMNTGLPWVTLKLALTLDGFIADADGKSQWITGEQSRQAVHRWRSQHNAIVVGSGTVLIDDPRLTVRNAEGKNPLRVILDPERTVSHDAIVLNDGDAETLIVHSRGSTNGHTKYGAGVHTLVLPENAHNRFEWRELLVKLYEQQGVLSVFVEGGAETASSLIHSRLVNEIILFTGPKIIGRGLSPFRLLHFPIDEALQVRLIGMHRYDDDVCLRYRLGEQ